jgi:hypothetical protein
VIAFEKLPEMEALKAYPELAEAYKGCALRVITVLK